MRSFSSTSSNLVKKIKVLFNVRCLSDPSLRGISRYTSELLKNLDTERIELILISDREIHLEHVKDVKYSSLVIKKMNYFFFEQIYVPFFGMTNVVDIYHNPNNFGTPMLGTFKKINTVHDTIDLFRPEKLSLKMKLFYWFTSTFHSKIISVSEHSKTDIEKYMNVESSHIQVIYEAGNLKADNSDTNVDNSKKYFFYLGGWEERKNIEFLVKAFAEVKDQEVKLILAGEKNENIYHKIESLVAQNNLEERVELKSWIEWDELISLYRNAYCFVYPSLYEGFGLQVLEAMEFDIPVICSNVSSLPEVHGLREATFSPTETSELSAMIDRVASDEAFRNNLVLHSKNRKKQFSWALTGKKTTEFYHSLI
jgi:glycosyltransferase involved in cell wall biosynthesis